MSKTFDRLHTHARRLGYTLLKEDGEHDGQRYRYMLRPHADPKEGRQLQPNRARHLDILMHPIQ